MNRLRPFLVEIVGLCKGVSFLARELRIMWFRLKKFFATCIRQKLRKGW